MIGRIWIAVAAFLAAAWPLSAQNGTYNGFSPYSVYGIGDLHAAGTAFNASMGGVGIATRNKRFVNTMNPASITARDSLSFMADFGLSGKFSVFSEGDLKGKKTLFNINDFVISFPMWRHTAFMVGIQPFSDTGFSMSYADKITTGDQSIGYTGNRAYGAYGDGGLHQFFAAASATLWNRLSVGAQYNLYFGTISKYSMSQFTDASYRSQTLGDTLQVRAHTAKFGLQYEQPVGTGKFVLGATYRLKARVTGHAIEYSNVAELDLGERDLAKDNIWLGDEILPPGQLDRQQLRPGARIPQQRCPCVQHGNHAVRQGGLRDHPEPERHPLLPAALHVPRGRLLRPVLLPGGREEYPVGRHHPRHDRSGVPGLQWHYFCD